MTIVVDVATGILFLYYGSGQVGHVPSAIPYYSIPLSFNLLLTLMVVIRLIVHTRNTRTVLGIAGIGGLYKTTITMLIESCVIFAANSLLAIVPWAAGESPITNFFTFILSESQVRDFLRLRSLGGLSNETTNWTGYRSPTRHSASPKQERFHE